MMKRLLSVGLLPNALLLGCVDVETEGCEHLQKGPSTTVAATNDWSIEAPAVSNDHQRYDITLPEGRVGYLGAVSFMVSEAADYTFFLSAEAISLLSLRDGQPVELKASANSTQECVRYVAPLQVGTHTLFPGRPRVDWPASGTVASQA